MGKKVVLGVELNRLFMQISYAPEGGVPATLHLPSSEQLFTLPLAIGRERGSSRWYYGQEAEKAFAVNQNDLARNFTVKLGEKTKIGGEVYTYEELLHMFLGHGIRMAMHSIEEVEKEAAEIMAMTLSVEPYPEGQMQVWNDLLSGLPIPRGQIRMQRHEDSLFSYLSHQPEKLLGYVTGVFDLTDERMVAYCMEMNPRTSPVVTSIERDDDTGIVKKHHYPSIMEQDRALEELDARLADYVEAFTKGRIVTSLYLIGDAFTKDWYSVSRHRMCRNRKVFAGNNLFSKGAAYAAAERIWPGTEKEDFLFLGKDMLRCNVGIQVTEDGEEGYLPLLDAGEHWNDATAETELLMSRPDEIRLLITPIFTGKTYEETLVIGEDEERPGRSFRYRLKVSMKDASVLLAELFDEGFGQFYQPRFAKKEYTITLRE